MLLIWTDGDEDLDTAFTTIQEKTNDELLAVGSTTPFVNLWFQFKLPEAERALGI